MISSHSPGIPPTISMPLGSWTSPSVVSTLANTLLSNGMFSKSTGGILLDGCSDV